MAVMSADFRRKKQEKWLESFYPAAPAEQYRQLDVLLNEAIEGPAPFLDSEALAYAANLVCQQLSRCNRLSELQALTERLAQVDADAMTLVLPFWNLQQLLTLLFMTRHESLPALLESSLARFDGMADAQWLSMLDLLAFYGQAPLAALLASELANRLGEGVVEGNNALDEAVVQHLLNFAFETYLTGPRNERAAKDMARQLKGVCKKSEIDYYLRELQQPAAAHLLSMERSLRADVGDDVLFYGHLSFGQWMLPQGINLLTSLVMMQHALELWEFEPAVPSFKKWVEVSKEQLLAYFNELEAPGGDANSAFVLAWGLPWIYAWLHEQNLCSGRYLAQMQHYCAELQTELMARRGPCLWSYAFVHRWSNPPETDPELFNAQAVAFALTRSQSLPLSDNPADSHAPTFIPPDDELLNVDLETMSAADLMTLLQRARLVYGDENLGVVLDHLSHD